MALVPLDIRQKHSKLLVDLCDLMYIDGPSYKNFVGYLHNAALPAGRLQRVKEEPMEVFHLMEERGILKEGDYSALEEALDASGYKQALELVKKVGSEITKQIEGQWSSTIAIQETSTEDDDYSSNKKRKTPIQENSAADDGLPSNKKKKSDDKDSYVEETDTTAASKDITPSPQPASLFQNKSPSVQVAAVTSHLSLIRPPSPQFISSGQQPSFGGPACPQLGKEESGAYGDMESQGQARNSSVLQDETELLEAIKNDAQKVEKMIRSKRIPKRSVIETAVKQDGYSKGVQFTLREMSKLLGREIRQVVGAWCGYKPKNPNTPVFVVTLKNRDCVLKKDEIPEPYIDYSIIIQYQYVPNDEERSIVEHYGNKSIRSEDVARLNNCIATHSERLMREHSNLSIIRPCPVKSRGYLRNEMDVIETICIVFYVPVKGIIPVGEEEFPKEIDGIVTDVREGEFYLFGGHNAMEYHKKLRMGCCITGGMTGTLGGFVDLPGEKVGCLTSAHVVLTDDQIKSYVNMVEEDKKKLNDSLAQGNSPIEIHQPTPCPGGKPFGRVQAIALDAGNIFSPSVDAAIIQITDDERKPDMGNFPDGDFENVGFTTEDPMLYTSGNILDDIEPRQRGSLVIKFGYKTGITRGFMEWLSGSVRPVDAWGNFCFPVMMGQFEVNTYNFAQKGDSGALVFLCSGGNIKNLNVIGMIVGGSTTGFQCFITPIQAVFEKLGLERFRFKVFPPKQLSQLETTSQPHIEHISTEQLMVIEENMKGSMSEHLMRIEQNISENVNEHFLSVEQNMNGNINERLLSFEQKISENLNERFVCVEHKIGENINQRFMVIEQNISERLTRAEQRTENSFNRIEELLKDLKGKP